MLVRPWDYSCLYRLSERYVIGGLERTLDVESFFDRCARGILSIIRKYEGAQLGFGLTMRDDEGYVGFGGYKCKFDMEAPAVTNHEHGFGHPGNEPESALSIVTNLRKALAHKVANDDRYYDEACVLDIEVDSNIWGSPEGPPESVNYGVRSSDGCYAWTRVRLN